MRAAAVFDRSGPHRSTYVPCASGGSRTAEGRVALGGTATWPAEVAARVVPWHTGADVLAGFRGVLCME